MRRLAKSVRLIVAAAGLGQQHRLCSNIVFPSKEAAIQAGMIHQADLEKIQAERDADYPTAEELSSIMGGAGGVESLVGGSGAEQFGAEDQMFAGIGGEEEVHYVDGGLGAAPSRSALSGSDGRYRKTGGGAPFEQYDFDGSSNLTPRQKRMIEKRDLRQGRSRTLPSLPWLMRFNQKPTHLDDAQRTYGRKEFWSEVDDDELRVKLCVMLRDFLDETVKDAQFYHQQARNQYRINTQFSQRYCDAVTAGLHQDPSEILKFGEAIWNNSEKHKERFPKKKNSQARVVVRPEDGKPVVVGIVDRDKDADGSSQGFSGVVNNDDFVFGTTKRNEGGAARNMKNAAAAAEQQVLAETNLYPFLRSRAVEGADDEGMGPGGGSSDLDPELQQWVKEHFPHDTKQSLAAPPELEQYLEELKEEQAERQAMQQQRDADDLAGGGVGGGLFDSLMSRNKQDARPPSSSDLLSRTRGANKSYENEDISFTAPISGTVEEEEEASVASEAANNGIAASSVLGKFAPSSSPSIPVSRFDDARGDHEADSETAVSSSSHSHHTTQQSFPVRPTPRRSGAAPPPSRPGQGGKKKKLKHVLRSISSQFDADGVFIKSKSGSQQQHSRSGGASRQQLHRKQQLDTSGGEEPGGVVKVDWGTIHKAKKSPKKDPSVHAAKERLQRLKSGEDPYLI